MLGEVLVVLVCMNIHFLHIVPKIAVAMLQSQLMMMMTTTTTRMMMMTVKVVSYMPGIHNFLLHMDCMLVAVEVLVVGNILHWHMDCIPLALVVEVAVEEVEGHSHLLHMDYKTALVLAPRDKPKQQINYKYCILS